MTVSRQELFRKLTTSSGSLDSTETELSSARERAREREVSGSMSVSVKCMNHVHGTHEQPASKTGAVERERSVDICRPASNTETMCNELNSNWHIRLERARERE